MATPARPEDIRNAVWAACDTFRGAVDADQYKNYVLAFLFLKYISDVWKAHAVQHLERLKDTPAETRELRVTRLMERERFKLKQFEQRNREGEVVDTFLGDFYSLHERRAADNIGELINEVLESIEEAKGNNWRRLHLPDRTLRLGSGEEGRRVLHPAQGIRAGREACRSQIWGPHLRSGLRFRLTPYPGGGGGQRGQFSALRPGVEWPDSRPRAHEHVPARARRGRHQVGRHAERAAVDRGRSSDEVRCRRRQPPVQPR